MKIVQINGSFGDSTSTGRSTKEMHAWLQKQGHVSSACRKRSPNGGLFVVKRGKKWYNEKGDRNAGKERRKSKPD